MSALCQKRTSACLDRTSATRVRDVGLALPRRDIDVPGPKLLGEFASQKLIDKARYFRFIAEELVEFAPVENKRSHAIRTSAYDSPAAATYPLRQ